MEFIGTFINLLLLTIVGSFRDHAVLRFRVSARALPDKDVIGATDPFLKIKYTEEDQREQKFLGKTNTLNDQLNPDWNEVFEFEYDQAKKQRFYFVVYDRDGPSSQETVGFAWTSVDRYVNSHQYLHVNLSRRGYLIIQKV